MLKAYTRKFGNAVVICLQGRIVRSETEALRKAVLVPDDASVVVLDLARVSTIDAGGLGVMLELRADAESRGIEFRLRNVNSLVKQILTITRLDSVFEISMDRETWQSPYSRSPRLSKWQPGLERIDFGVIVPTL
jgi:anti-anti-sigma factor